jgi:hypothetical protein
MKTESRWYSETAHAWIAEGEAKGVLLILETRGIEVTEEQRQRITGCGDPEQLEAWIRRAVTVTSADELFTET